MTTSLFQLMPALSSDEFASLKADIAERGVMVPIEYDESGNVLDGHHRLRACAELGVTDYPRMIRAGMSEEQKIEHALALNLERRHLDAEQRRVLAAKLRERRLSYPRIAAMLGVDDSTVLRDLGRSTSADTEVERVVSLDGKLRPATMPTADEVGERVERVQALRDTGHTVRQIAGKVGASIGTVSADLRREPTRAPASLLATNDREQRKAERLVEYVQPGSTVSVTDAAREAKSQRKAEVIEQAVATAATMPPGVFSVIVVDPPWQYDARAADASHRAANPYPTMTQEQLAAMELPHADDCVLWLWTTNAFMHDAYHLIDAWGFEPKTILTWAKDRMGLGDGLRGQTEHCILAVRGKPSVRLASHTTLLNGPMREHSRKPDEFYALVDELCIGRKLDVFSRTPRDGWDQYGNQPDCLP